MADARDVLWRSVEPLLRGFAERIARSNSAVSYSVASTSNQAFLLRGYAALRKATAEDEVAVTVDAALRDGDVVLSVDACMDNGEVLAQGPGGTLPLAAILSGGGMPFAEWLQHLGAFLASIETPVKERVEAL
jgi:hypothetical protein